MKKQPTRRSFIGSTAAAAAGMLASSPAKGRSTGKPGPNDTVQLGLIGCGGQGRAVMRNHIALDGVTVVAVCDLNEKRLADGVKDSGNPNVKTYRDYRELLENKDINAVIIGTNGHWHVLPAVNACQAGKDVYVEKPLGTSIGEGRAVVEAAEKYDRIVQIGTQQRSGEHYQKAAEIVQSGRLGEISEVKVWDYDNFYPGFGSPSDEAPPPEFGEHYWDFWVGPSPKAPYNPNRFRHHYWFFDYGGGWQLDWAVHHYDIVNWYMGVTGPETITALGGFKSFEKTNTQWPDTFSGICEYGPGPVARKGFLMHYTFRGGCVHTPTYNESHAKLFCGTEGSLLVNRSGYKLFAEKPQGADAQPWAEKFLTKVVEDVPATDDLLRKHAQHFIDCVRNNKKPYASAETGHYASCPGHLMNIAWRLRRTIEWDGQSEKILNDPDANFMVTKKYRAPWRLSV